MRVPLSGRRVKGYVVELAPRDPARLRDIAQVSGRSPVFDEGLLGSLRWAAAHYVAPLGPVLDRSAPPNVPPAAPKSVPSQSSRSKHKLTDLVDRAASGRVQRSVVLLDNGHDALAPLATDCLASGVSLVVIAPTVRLVERVVGALESAAVPVHAVTSDLAAKEVTSAWRVARHSAAVLVGTPKVASWGFRTPAVLYVVEESRRAMKDRQTPTIAVRDMVLARAKREAILPVFAGPTPSAELMGVGPETRRVGSGRLWPLVEVIDRRQESAGGGVLAPATKQAIKSVSRDGAVFVYAHLRGYAAAARCVACRSLRVCPVCGSRPGVSDACVRCGHLMAACLNCGKVRFEPLGAGVGRLVEEIGRIVGPDTVGDMGARRPIRVGTERDLNSLIDFDLAILADADGLIRGANYRSAEEALRIGARLARSVRSGGRLIVQTSDPTHHAIVAIRRADPMGFHEVELEQRRTYGFPPVGELLVIEARDLEDVESAHSELVSIGSTLLVMGPADNRGRTRWLIQAPDLSAFKTSLRPIVGRWRDNGAAVRIDADPIDL